jgi:hypothetical protein
MVILSALAPVIAFSNVANGPHTHHDKAKAAGRNLRWRKHRHMHLELKTTLLQRKVSDPGRL